ncbi:rhodanese-like domain-containing protein [Floricoccus penangensis]|uniref:NADH dehydrogenase n=1 Tax=Floricoccus penangensis TaxID=1859475 RepID=A0A9Q5JIF0_9LACT|nr:rhodanese-like domain-containing protein [Floricoccus penangensis]OFI47846.1 NADH dehydrogenase [Floricoccus penangensis]URZ87854.1 rhodanese-like domain-containing protein [Floricoccus penangensis]
MLAINLILLAVLLAMAGWSLYKTLQVRRGSKKINNEEFAELIPQGQLVDIREPSEFRIKHILGARNIPANQIGNSLAALNKNKPVLIYEMGRPQQAVSVVPTLKKAGFTEIYLLKDGLAAWDGKVK